MLRLKTLPRSHDAHGMIVGFQVARPESMPSAEITSYKPTPKERHPFCTGMS